MQELRQALRAKDTALGSQQMMLAEAKKLAVAADQAADAARVQLRAQQTGRVQHALQDAEKRLEVR